jgi:hypothetical protein
MSHTQFVYGSYVLVYDRGDEHVECYRDALFEEEGFAEVAGISQLRGKGEESYVTSYILSDPNLDSIPELSATYCMPGRYS